MPWGDRAVSPCVFVPGVADADKMSLSNGIDVVNGAIRVSGPEFLPGCFLALYPNNYSANPGGTAQWLDISGQNNHLIQTSESLKPTIETYDGKLSVRTGPTPPKNLRKSWPINGVTQGLTEVTILFALANRMSSGTDRYAFALKGDTNSSVKTDLFAEWGGASSGGGSRLDMAGGYAKDSTFNQLDILPKDGSFRIFGISQKQGTTIYVATPSVTSFTANTEAISLFGGSSPEIIIGGHPSDANVYYHDVNFFSFHAWNRALSQSELNDAATMMAVKLGL